MDDKTDTYMNKPFYAFSYPDADFSGFIMSCGFSGTFYSINRKYLGHPDYFGLSSSWSFPNAVNVEKSERPEVSEQCTHEEVLSRGTDGDGIRTRTRGASSRKQAEIETDIKALEQKGNTERARELIDELQTRAKNLIRRFAIDERTRRKLGKFLGLLLDLGRAGDMFDTKFPSVERRQDIEDLMAWLSKEFIPEVNKGDGMISSVQDRLEEAWERETGRKCVTANGVSLRGRKRCWTT